MSHGPFRIRITKTVASDMPYLAPRITAEPGEYEAWCNQNGAVWIFVGEKMLGVRPGEFEYVTLPPAGVPLALTPERVRELAESSGQYGCASSSACLMPDA